MDNTFASVAEKFIEYIKANKERKAKDVERDYKVSSGRGVHRPIASIKPFDIALMIDGHCKARQTRPSAQ